MAVNAGARLDRLPISSFHRRIMWLIGAGMFFDGFNIYLGGAVLGTTVKSGFSTLSQNAEFVSATFAGMMLGSFVVGFLGDRFGRRFTYQSNLATFGFGAVAAAFAPSMQVLILVQFVIGFGLGAENVVGYSTLTEFVPPHTRGRWLGLAAVFLVTGLPVAMLVGSILIPRVGWRAMFVIGGIGALVVWYMRKALPESPRWLESVGRTAEAEALLGTIESEVVREHGALPAPALGAASKHSRDLSSLLSSAILPRMILGSVSLVVVNSLLYGFVTWLPTFFVQQGLSVARSFGYSLVMAFGAPLGAATGALTADSWGRKPTIVGASLATILIAAVFPFITQPVLLMAAGFLLMVPIYMLVAILFAVYIPELFPTEVRLRAAGICNTFGRGAIIFTSFIVVALFKSHGVGGVLAFMTGLLLVQIVVVLALGVEPKKRGLEEIEADPSVVPVPREAGNP